VPRLGKEQAIRSLFWIVECTSRIPLLSLLNNDFNKFKALLINLFISLFITQARYFIFVHCQEWWQAEILPFMILIHHKLTIYESIKRVIVIFKLLNNHRVDFSEGFYTIFIIITCTAILLFVELYFLELLFDLTFWPYFHPETMFEYKHLNWSYQYYWIFNQKKFFSNEKNVNIMSSFIFYIAELIIFH
jgi:hypothetical protein